MRPSSHELLIDIQNLKTHFPLDEGTVKAVDGVDFQIYRNRTLCVVGESGCGKSITARSILQIVDKPGRIVEGSILYHRQPETGGSEVISSDVAGPSAPQRTGGQLWLRLRGDVFGTWRAMWGVGSAGALPTAWTTAVSVSIAAIGPAVPATAGMEMWVGSAGGTPLAATHTVDVLAIRDSWSDSL